jgi:hypothetical protein
MQIIPLAVGWLALIGYQQMTGVCASTVVAWEGMWEPESVVMWGCSGNMNSWRQRHTHRLAETWLLLGKPYPIKVLTKEHEITALAWGDPDEIDLENGGSRLL